MDVRAATRSDFTAILALNAESERFLSPLTEARLVALDAASELHWVVESDGTVIAFVLAFREAADYDSVNYRWFVQRYPHFLYIDRVVVAAARQGSGAGALLYRSAFAHAAATAVPMITCEYDLQPHNPGSARFHARFGFTEVGQQVVGSGKLVSLQVATVPQQ
jgi:predicted GNAT superfamily acetyltransferase